MPLRLLPPSRLVGRDDEIAALQAAFTEAVAGRCAGVLVAGAPGVGKTTLIDELRPVVTAGDGWFVAGKFDQYRRDQEFDVVQSGVACSGPTAAGRTGGRNWLSVRGRLLAAVGAERGSAGRGGPGVRGAAGGAARSGGSADRAGPGPAQRRWRCCGRWPRRNGRWWCSWMTCSGPAVPRWASWIWCWARSRSRGCCWWARTARTRLDAAHPLAALLARWRRAGPGAAAAAGNLPAVELGGDGGGDAAGGPGQRGGAGRGDRRHTRPAIRTTPWSCSTRCARTGC